MAGAARVPVLMYHRVGEPADRWEHRLCVRPARFAAQMQRLHAHGFTAVSVEAFAAWLRGKERLPARSVVLSFDDGFDDVYHHAAPVLRRLGWPAVMFLVSDRIGESNRWDTDANPAVRSHRLLTLAQITELAQAGWSFHAHSRSHRLLPEADDATLADEVAGAAAELRRLGLPPRYYCYPYGGVNARVAAAVREAGYEAAFTTRSGFAEPGADPLWLPRVEVWGTDSPGLLLRKIVHGAHADTLPARAAYRAWETCGRLTASRATSRLVWYLAGGRSAG